MIRAIRYFEREERINILTMVITMLAITAYFWLLFPADLLGTLELPQLVVSFLTFFVSIIMVSDVIQSYSRRYTLMISGGILRRDVFLSQAVQEIVYPLLYVLLIIAVRLSTGIPFTVSYVCTIIGMFYCSAGFGNILAIVTDRFGRAAYVAFIVVVAALGGVMGGFSSQGGFSVLVYVDIPLLILVGPLVLAGSFFFLYRSIMKIEVRS